MAPVIDNNPHESYCVVHLESTPRTVRNYQFDVVSDQSHAMGKLTYTLHGTDGYIAHVQGRTVYEAQKLIFGIALHACSEETIITP